MSFNPELFHDFEATAHASFYESLEVCEKEANSLDNPYFTMCMKAAGYNFFASYEKWMNFKKHLLAVHRNGQGN